jgi:serine/threonine protein kinase
MTPHQRLAAKVAMNAALFRPAAGAEPVPGYRLEALLGRGGFGEVWRAAAPGGFQVALKFLPADEAASERELKSLQLLQGVRDGHLLALFGVWAVPGWFVLAMELADRTLMDRLNDCLRHGLPGVPRTELLRCFGHAAQGLDFLNAARHILVEGGQPARIQHGDVKPQNLLLVGDTCKLGDFGLARRLAATAVAKHTASLTPAYAPPEVFEGRSALPSDQYSLAVTWCQLRGGRLPFEGGPAQLMAGHMLKPPDLSMLPEAERAAVARALSKKPEERWPTCRAFVDELGWAAPAVPVAQAWYVPDVPTTPGTSEKTAAPSVAPTLEPPPRPGGPTAALPEAQDPRRRRNVVAPALRGFWERPRLWAPLVLLPLMVGVAAGAIWLFGPRGSAPSDKRAVKDGIDLDKDTLKHRDDSNPKDDPPPKGLPKLDPTPVIQVQFADGKTNPPPQEPPRMDRGRDSMRFGVTMTDDKGNPKRLTYDPYGRTNNTVLRVDGKDFIFGDALDGGNNQQGKWEELASKLPADPTGRVPQGSKSVWRLLGADLVVTQTIEVAPSDPDTGETKRRLKTLLVRYKIENKSNREQVVGLRFLLDTFIGANDGVPFIIPGDPKLCETQMKFPNAQLPNVPDYIFAVENKDPNNRGTVAQVQLRLSKELEAPNRVQLSGWPDQGLRELYTKHSDKRNIPMWRDAFQAGGLLDVWEELKWAQEQYTLWDVPYIKFSALADTHIKKKDVNKEFDPDSAVVMYWDPQPLKPGASREVGFAYGLGGVSSGGGDSRILLTHGGELEAGGTWTLNALVSDRAPGETLTLEVPRGCELTQEKAEQQVPEPSGGRSQSPVNWHIKAASPGVYKLKVTSSATKKTSVHSVTIKAAGGIFRQ